MLDNANTCISDLKLLRQQYVDTACSAECNTILDDVTSNILSLSSRVTKLQSQGTSENASSCASSIFSSSHSHGSSRSHDQTPTGGVHTPYIAGHSTRVQSQMTGQIILKTLSLLPCWRGLKYKLPLVVMVASGHPHPGTKNQIHMYFWVIEGNGPISKLIRSSILV